MPGYKVFHLVDGSARSLIRVDLLRTLSKAAKYPRPYDQYGSQIKLGPAISQLDASSLVDCS